MENRVSLGKKTLAYKQNSINEIQSEIQYMQHQIENLKGPSNRNEKIRKLGLKN